MTIPTICEARRIKTPRLETRVLFHGDEEGVPIIFVHGNMSAATWWEATMTRLPSGYRAIAPDLRAYGEADDAAKVDATRGLRDFSDDLVALMGALGLEAAHFVGHSLGGGVCWQLMADHPGKVLSLTQVAPASPYGFGGCALDGALHTPDNAGAGGGSVNPEFAALLAAKERGGDSPSHPRTILCSYAWKPPHIPDRMEDILTSALAQHTGDADYPGDMTPSAHWPMVAPGRFGPINALSPLYQTDPLAFTRTGSSAPILWVRGADDSVISDASLFDLGTLGQMGAVPGWPGEDAYPAQPMIAQTEAALATYAAAGGRVERAVFNDCGHSPYLEKPAQFDAALHGFLAALS